MSWEYFDPSKHGLERVTSVDWLAGQGSYEWDDTTIMYNKSDKLFYWEHAYGCSCNTPLDNVKSLDDLRKGKVFSLAEELKSKLAEYEVSDDHDDRSHWYNEKVRAYGVLTLEVADAIAKCLSVKDADIDN